MVSFCVSVGETILFACSRMRPRMHKCIGYLCLCGIDAYRDDLLVLFAALCICSNFGFKLEVSDMI